jgi:hypothetical protein
LGWIYKTVTIAHRDTNTTQERVNTLSIILQKESENMALSQAQKDKLVASGQMAKYSGKSWDEVEKILNSSNSNSSSSNSSNNDRTNGQDGGGNTWYTTPSGKQIAVRPGADVILDDNGYFLGTRTQSGKSSYTSEYRGGSTNNNYSSNTGAISDQYDQQRKSLIAQLKASIAKAKGGYTDIINKAPQTYQPLRNQNEVTKEQQLATMREALANQGNAGGTGRQELLNINTAAGNRMNDINLQQQNVINDANSAISNLEEQAAFKESEITADMASQKLRDLIAEQTRIDELNREQERYAQEYADRQKQQEFENNLTQQKYNDSLAAQQLERDINSIGAYSNDYMAEIQRRQSTGDTADDALIPYLQAVRNEKIAQQRAQADNTANQAYKNAYQLWLQLGVATQEIADILGIPKGSKTLDKIKADYSTAKPYYSPNTGGSDKGLSW